MTIHSLIDPRPTVPQQALAAIFIDFENVYYELRRGTGSIDATEYILSSVRNLRTHLAKQLSTQSIILKAYADFERLDSSPQGSLYLMGVETHNVLSTEYKNSADMRLCIDALDVLYTRPEIDHFVLMAGDRDYIPLVQHLRRHGRKVFITSFKANLSGDLLQNIESEKFIDAETLLSEEERHNLERARAWTEHQRTLAAALEERKAAEMRAAEKLAEEKKMLLTPVLKPASNGSASDVGSEPLQVTGGAAPLLIKRPVQPLAANGYAAKAAELAPDIDGLYDDEHETDFAPAVEITDFDTRECLSVMLAHYGRHKEIWMSPLLWKLSNNMPTFADFERKALIANLQAAGAVQVAKRRGQPNDYSVVIINYNHPTVRECMP
jgi:uncharacterized LabA/DUF88 family protein